MQATSMKKNTHDDISADLLIDYRNDLAEHFLSVPEIGKPLLSNARIIFSRIEKMLYSMPEFIKAIKASIPKETYQAIFTPEQKLKIAKGSLKLMTKKNGYLMANIINPESKRIVSTIPLKNVKHSPELLTSITNYSTQMQLAQIAEQIELIQIAVEEVRQGQEYDRLAIAYSCQQKLLQAMTLKNPELKAMALMQIASNAEDSRNLLMLSQNNNLTFIKNQPESTLKKIFSSDKSDKIESRMKEIRESLNAVNMVSLTEAIAYQELGETEAARQSLQYYARYIHKTYLKSKGLVDRLDSIDPSPENYWSKTLPYLEKKILGLPYDSKKQLYDGG